MYNIIISFFNIFISFYFNIYNTLAALFIFLLSSIDKNKICFKPRLFNDSKQSNQYLLLFGLSGYILIKHLNPFLSIPTNVYISSFSIYSPFLIFSSFFIAYTTNYVSSSLLLLHSFIVNLFIFYISISTN